jgi:hypothetical protein
VTGATGGTGLTGGTGATGTPGPGNIPPVIAAGVFIGTTVQNSRGFAAPVFTAPNQIDLTLTSPPANIDNVVLALALFSPLSGNEISFGLTGPATISVFTWSSAGVPAEVAFSIVVYDNTP